MGYAKPPAKPMWEHFLRPGPWGAKRTLWRILSALSLVEDEPSETSHLQEEARHGIEHVADHICDEVLRISFLSPADVRTVFQQIPSTPRSARTAALRMERRRYR